MPIGNTRHHSDRTVAFSSLSSSFKDTLGKKTLSLRIFGGTPSHQKETSPPFCEVRSQERNPPRSEDRMTNHAIVVGELLSEGSSYSSMVGSSRDYEDQKPKVAMHKYSNVQRTTDIGRGSEECDPCLGSAQKSFRKVAFRRKPLSIDPTRFLPIIMCFSRRSSVTTLQ